jgi:hypothetical protein
VELRTDVPKAAPAKPKTPAGKPTGEMHWEE